MSETPGQRMMHEQEDLYIEDCEDVRGRLALVEEENARLRREKEHMYQRALDAESHAAFGPMDVDERVRMLRAALDQEEDQRARAEEENARLRRENAQLAESLDKLVAWFDEAPFLGAAYVLHHRDALEHDKREREG